ncbi:MAG: chromate efflux transporter [Marinovum sp.]|nr:chromate efflux transporter [Marinovum sp.]
MKKDHELRTEDDQADLSALFRVFGKIGLLSFGGPAAQIALLHRETVDTQGWLDEQSYLRGLSFCMMLPGPEAMQLATYIGWRLRGTLGGLMAGVLFILPGVFVIAALSAIYISFGDQTGIEVAFLGIQSAVFAIVVSAFWRLAKKALTGSVEIAIAVVSFGALFAFGVPFPVVVACAALVGALRRVDASAECPPMPKRDHLPGVLAIWGGLWAAPLVVLGLMGGGVLFDLALFFGKLAITTFGGAYAVLAYMTQEVVQARAWLSTDQMIDALGLAETTPGPLILVTQFVGQLVGQAQGGWALWLAAGLVTLWMTFIPCFLWIFAGAPYLEAITAKPRISASLQAITAAIVGVMASLGVWFAINVFFATVTESDMGLLNVPLPEPSSFKVLAFVCFLIAGLTLWGRGWSVPPVLGLGVLIALALTRLGL